MCFPKAPQRTGASAKLHEIDYPSACVEGKTDPGPALSVVIPAHDRPGSLDVAICSVLRSPLITSPRQIIVVDDDSVEDVAAVAQRHGVTYQRVNYRNISSTRNAGLAVARTEFVTFLDDDDAWLPGNMEPQLAALQEQPEAAFAYGIARCATWELEPTPWTFPSRPLPSGRVPGLFHVGYPNLGVVLFRRALLTETEGFDSGIRYGEDADLMLRLAVVYPIVGLDFVGMLYRLRRPSKSRADYFWSHRAVLSWSPHYASVSLLARARFQWKMRSIHYQSFCEDAFACAAVGQPANALVCTLRAIAASPVHALRHSRTVVAMLYRCLIGLAPSPRNVNRVQHT